MLSTPKCCAAPVLVMRLGGGDERHSNNGDWRPCDARVSGSGEFRSWEPHFAVAIHLGGAGESERGAGGLRMKMRKAVIAVVVAASALTAFTMLLAPEPAQ